MSIVHHLYNHAFACLFKNIEKLTVFTFRSYIVKIIATNCEVIDNFKTQLLGSREKGDDSHGHFSNT